jgi:hypothetical protein
MADLFRKSSLERLSSPEQLDKAITISSPVSWLALIGITVIIAATALWSVFGTLPTTVTSAGIVTKDGKTAVCFVPYAYSFGITPDMDAVVSLAYKSPTDGQTQAQVISVGRTAATLTEMSGTLGSDNMLVSYFIADGPIAEINLEIKGEPLPVGALISAQIITREESPIAKLFVGLSGR